MSKESSEGILEDEDDDQVSDFLKRVILENNNISDEDDSIISHHTSNKQGNVLLRKHSMTPKLKSQTPMMGASPFGAYIPN